MKLSWSNPQMTEIKVEMTSDQKIGFKADGEKLSDGSDLCGDRIPCDCS